DALALERVVPAGYDWGGRAACIAAALWPERVLGLVSANGYNIQDIAGSVKPAAAEQEYRLWYQYYFHTERGRAGLHANRREFCRLLWRLLGPRWGVGGGGAVPRGPPRGHPRILVGCLLSPPPLSFCVPRALPPPAAAPAG